MPPFLSILRLGAIRVSFLPQHVHFILYAIAMQYAYVTYGGICRRRCWVHAFRTSAVCHFRLRHFIYSTIHIELALS